MILIASKVIIRGKNRKTVLISLKILEKEKKLKIVPILGSTCNVKKFRV